MNLYGRLLAAIVEGIRAPKVAFFEKTSISFRVLPHDCDPNMHLTNSRYLTFCDLARIHGFISFGIMKACLKKGWFPVVDAQEIRYFRGIKPFQKFTIKSQFVAWDEKYLYCVQEFIVNSKIVAIAHVRGGLLGKKGIVAPHIFAKTLLENMQSPSLPPYLEKWSAILDEVKEHAITGSTSKT